MKVTLNFCEEEPEYPIPGFDGYFATYSGEIISYKRGKREIKKVNLGKKGYCTVGLTPNGTSQQNRQRIHIMVALAWISNPENKPQVNHKDGNKQNNCVKNLEWATSSEQIRHAYKTGLIVKISKAVCQTDPEGNVLAEFESTKAASKATGCSESGISACCTGKQRLTMNFGWFYKDSKIKDIRGHKNARMVQQFDLNGKFLAEFKSIRLASAASGCQQMSIISVCKGKQKRAGLFKWKYKEKPKSEKELLQEETKDWIELSEYPRYRISRDGRIFSDKTKIILKNIWSGADESVTIRKINESMGKNVMVHRLVAMAYIPNPNDLPVVNHLDTNQRNNKVENLEWATSKRNTQHATDAGVMNNRTAIIQMDLNCNIICRHDSFAAAARKLGVKYGSINDAARGRNKTAYGFKWKYEE